MKQIIKLSEIYLVISFVLITHVNLYSQPELIHHRAVIKPSLVCINPGQTQPFKVVMVATRLMAASNPEKVIWTVNDIPNGNDQIGTIDEQGIYQR